MRTRTVVIAAIGMAVALIPVAAVAAGWSSPEPRVLAACDETIDTTDSFSMDCAPTMIPDFSDQLTEAEVAEPGWNAVPGGSAGPGGGPRR